MLLACSVLLLAGAAVTGSVVFRRLFPPRNRVTPDRPWELAVLLFGVTTLFAVGLGWGLPDTFSWAPDEIAPDDLHDAVVSRFSGGWTSIYPPLHYVLLAAVTAPFHVAIQMGRAEIGAADLRTWLHIALVSRALTALMSAATVAIVFGLTREIAGRRAARFAAVVTAAALPLAYYAKTSNVDAPGLFWVALSLAFLVRALTGGRAADFYLFTAAGVAAIATKDQNYGYYVLPAIWLVAGRWRRGRHAATPGMPSPRVVLTMAMIAVAGLLLLYNVPFNPVGFREHVRLITGVGSAYYRMYPATGAGHVQLLWTSVMQLGNAMSWPLFLAGACGAAFAIVVGERSIRWLLLPLASYYLTVIAVVGYHYDRFFLGVIVILAIAGGWWLDRWTGDGVRYRGLRLALVALAIAYGLIRVVALDAMMVRDARYYVESWMNAHTVPTDRIAAVGLETYLPRKSKVRWTHIERDLAALAAEKPDYVIVNVAYGRRYVPDSGRHLFYEALSAGKTGYARVLRYRTRLPWSPLNWERRFTDVREDPFSNLTKINPMIEVYRRVEATPR